jgi:hypothetical protein
VLTSREFEILTMALPSFEDDIELDPDDIDILNDLWARGLMARFLGKEGQTVFETTERGIADLRRAIQAAGGD